MKTKFDIDMIDRYLEGRLNKEDLILFEERLKSDPEFAQDLEIHKMAINAVFVHGRDELKQKLNDIHDNRIKKTITMRVSYRVAASIAAVFLISSVVFYLTANRTPNYSKLFDESFVPYQDMISQQSRGDNSENKPLINDAMKYYNEKKFDKAILLFDKIVKNKQSNDAVIYYYGISCLGSKENNIAIELLSQLSVNPGSMFFEQAKWYLALAYLYKQDKENTAKILHEIILKGTFNSQKAKELLDKIE